MRRLLVTGGSGYLGQYLTPLAGRQGYQTAYTYYSRNPLTLSNGFALDLRDKAATLALVKEWRPEVIVHTAGSNRSPDMEQVIVRGAAHIVEAAALVGARLIHLSSDVVFNGRQAPYRESDPPDPIHEYGRAKAEAEKIVARYPNHVIVRTSLIYGRERVDRSSEWIVAKLRQREPVTLFDNQFRNPVWVETLSLACLELAGHAYRGILNVAGRQAMSRADFGLKLLDWWGVQERETLTIGPSSPEWPLDCRLDLTLAGQLLQTPLWGVDEALSDVKRET